jgi:hypothetical protein
MIEGIRGITFVSRSPAKCEEKHPTELADLRFKERITFEISSVALLSQLE